MCAAINSSRSEDWQYPLDVLHSLIDRYEEPDFSASWDRPLVFVQEGNEIPMERLKQVLIDATPPPPNFSTMNVTHIGCACFTLYKLETTRRHNVFNSN